MNRPAVRIDAIEQVEKHRTAGNRMQHLVDVRAHPCALAGSQYDNGEAALIVQGVAHGAEQWHGAAAGARLGFGRK